MRDVMRVLEAAKASAKDRRAGWAIDEIQFADDYAEPGYTAGKAGIAFGDWNRISDYKNGEFVEKDNTLPRLASILERMGFELEWCDEWLFCEHCYRAVRCHGDSYSWTASYWQSYDGTVLCQGCVLEDPSEYLEELSGDPSRAVTLDLDLSEHGYKQVGERYENGMYGGQCSDPKIIAESLREAGIEDFIFEIASVGQFDLDFTVWIPEDTELYRPIRSEGSDPAEAMKAALQDASAKMASLPDGEGVKYAQCKPDGTAAVRVVGPEEFVRGIGR